MNIDQKIKDALEKESQSLDTIIPPDTGLFSMLLHAYKGMLGGWIILMSVVSLVIGSVLIWSAYEFFFSPLSYEAKSYWGVILLLSGMMVTAIKMWLFMEMNRQSTNREIKRLELAIVQLSQQLKNSPF